MLLSGRRLASYLTGIVDTDLLPLAAVGRVEVLKDGAAATYGSDAISGVATSSRARTSRGWKCRSIIG